jgi:hypothetical protein
VITLDILVGLGTLMSGLAAVGQLFTRWHIQRLRVAVDGQTHQLVAVSHTLGVAEGVLQEKAEQANGHTDGDDA